MENCSVFETVRNKSLKEAIWNLGTSELAIMISSKKIIIYWNKLIVNDNNKGLMLLGLMYELWRGIQKRALKNQWPTLLM